MKSILFSLSLLIIFSLSGYSQMNCSPILDTNTIVIKKDTALACSGPSKSYLICPGVKVSYFDNSCTSSFYLENNAEIHFDSTSSYGYAKVWAKNSSVLDANYRQFMEFHQETATTIRDTTSSTSPVSSNYVCPMMTFNYSNLPGGVSGCGNTVGLEKSIEKEISLEVYPNPATNILNIKTNESTYSLKLISLVGKVVWEGSSITKIQLDYPKGIYFLQLTSKNKKITKKVVLE